MLTKEEIAAIMPVLDAGVRAAGLQVFQNGAGRSIQSALDKLQMMADMSAPQEKDATSGKAEL